MLLTATQLVTARTALPRLWLTQPGRGFRWFPSWHGLGQWCFREMHLEGSVTGETSKPPWLPRSRTCIVAFCTKGVCGVAWELGLRFGVLGCNPSISVGHQKDLSCSPGKKIIPLWGMEMALKCREADGL